MTRISLIGVFLTMSFYTNAMFTPNTPERRLELVVVQSDLERTKKVLEEEKPDLAACYGEHEENILIRAINKNMNAFDVVNLLVERGVNINAIAKDGNTPLFQALFCSQSRIALLLLERGADTNHQIKLYGHPPLTPLQLAQKFCLEQVVQKIIANNKAALNKEHEQVLAP